MEIGLKDCDASVRVVVMVFFWRNMRTGIRAAGAVTPSSKRDND
jgi:hypothetical protein